MKPRPGNIEDLSALLKESLAKHQPLQEWDLGQMNRMIHHAPEDMTATVEAGMTLQDLQRHLAGAGQWLPLDPAQPDQVSIAMLLAENRYGPRRYGYGAVREHLIGIRMVLADGQIVKSGGLVMKNVAGFDLCRLMVGNRDTLAIIAEASFRLRPIPESEKFLKVSSPSWEAAQRQLEEVLNSALTPVILDLHNLTEDGDDTAGFVSLVIGLAGTKPEVDWQMQEADRMGINQPATLDYEARFWRQGAQTKIHTRSVLPSKLCEILESLGNIPVVARAGNGIFHYAGGEPPARSHRFPSALLNRVKSIFDPENILPQPNW